MQEILKLNAIADVVKKHLPENLFTITEDAKEPVGILVRSADMHEYDFPASVVAVARAGAGVNNIPIDKCTEKGIVVFNTPGANANAVKELVLGTMIMASRNLFAAGTWVNGLKGNGDAIAKMAEKGKSQFVGPEIKGKTLGVIGLGAIGGLVANAAVSLGMNVLGYDPFMSVDAAWNLSRGVRKADSLAQVIAESDVITLHVPLLDSTRNVINKDTIATMRDGVIILNFARGGLVNNADVLDAIAAGKVHKYATDFAEEELLGKDGVIVLPHLGASTPESESNCADMAAKELYNYIHDGVIKNSVNYPTLFLPRTGSARLTIAHKNIANMVGQITAAIAAHGENISGMINGSRGELAYTIIDIDNGLKPGIVEMIEKVDGVIRVRSL